MTHTVLWEIAILAGILWIVAMGFVAFSFVLLRRQQIVFEHIVARLARLDEALLGKKKQLAEKPQVSIPKNEPIAKYESVSLPDDVQISFVEKEN